jgi:stage V sporulation protein K
MKLTKEFLQELNKASINILEICNLINSDIQTITSLNNLLPQKKESELILKVEKIFISDFIFVFSKVNNISQKAQFGLAYYYDAIRNRHFANENDLENLNKLIISFDFKSHFNKILQENVLFDLSKSKTYLLNYFYQNNHPKLNELKQVFYTFLKLVCDLEFDNNDNFKDILGIDFNINNVVFNQDDSLEKVMEELNGLVGLDNVKKDVAELINLLKIQQKRTVEGLKNFEITLHTVFLGPPGTGKTTVARLLGRIFKHLELLTKGQLIETDREGMVAGFVGQTATKVDAIVNEAKGGVLFIDEAYALSQSISNDYGSEAVNILLKRMEDFRDDLSVVVAGYEEPMQVFIDSNPGLRSRFNRYFYFDHFTPDQLFSIFESYCIKSDFIIDIEAREKLKDTFELLYEKRDNSFGNARVIRNIFEKCVQKQANRIVHIKKLSKKSLSTLIQEDIPEPKEILEYVFYEKK